jgi:glyoxylase-like metal-dependent hydrolase (beta-lactamase superfamily II)
MPRPGEAGGPWLELGDQVFTKRYPFWDQQIGAVMGRGVVLVVDTRITPRMAREIVDDLRALTGDPVAIAVNTHWHADHTFGNQVFRPAAIWGHERTPGQILERGGTALAGAPEYMPDLALDLAEVVLDPPNHVFSEAATLDVGGRPVELHYLGRGHTDTDIVVEVPDAEVVFAGDLVAGDTLNFSHAFPLDWPGTAARLLELVRGPVVPGHGAVGGHAFVVQQQAILHELSRLSREIEAGRMSTEDALGASPIDRTTTERALARSLAQLRGELD